ncbi:MAG: cytochrome c [Alphaproteobacteria bacterium]|nr:cytochrome c [Alphaproteobacteria bacterium]MBT7942391.1 cytochrome c [Alphaproteobacteria bacterium]
MESRKKLLVIAVFAIAAGLFWVFGPGGQLGGGLEDGTVTGVDIDDAPLVERGKAVYAEHCASCHGPELEGEMEWRKRNPDGTLKAPPHDETGHTWHHADLQMFDYTQKGGQAVAPPGFTSAMPAFGVDYGGALSDDDVWAVLTFIHSRWPARVIDRQRQINERSK